MGARERLINIVNNARGDDLERAQHAFGHMTKSQLDQQYGQSGKTCREILEEYEDERAEWQAARDLLRRILP